MKQYGRGQITIEKNKTLSDLGITKNQSSQWQKIADIPEEEFESYIPEH